MTEPVQRSPKPSAAPKVFDVMRPGRAPASPNSRPVIVSHGPEVQDATLTDKPSSLDAPTPARPKLLDSRQRITITPPPQTKSLELPADPEMPPLPQETAPELSATPAIATPAPEVAQPESVPSTTPTPQTPAESSVESAPVAAAVSSLPLDAIQDQQTTYTPLADHGEQGQPVVSHHAAGRPSRRKLVLVFVVLIVMAAIVATLAIVEIKAR